MSLWRNSSLLAINRSCGLSFDEIEHILDFPLPKSAYEHDAWWRNNDAGHSHARLGSLRDGEPGNSISRAKK